MINTKSSDLKNVRSKSHKNFMGGVSYDINDPFLKLHISAASCFFGEPKYYLETEKKKSARRAGSISQYTSINDLPIAISKQIRANLVSIDRPEWHKLTPKQVMEKVIDEALDVDVEKTLRVAVSLRNDDNMRATPQVILVRAANHKKSKGTRFVRQYAKKIIKRADEPATCLAYQLAAFGKPVPSSLKRALKDSLESFNEYQLGKYRMDNRGVKTVDVINIVHANSEAIDKLMNKKLKNTGKTWEAITSSKGSTKESWEESVKVMGHMALLRNLRNLITHKVPLDSYKDKLVKYADKGKQLPFRYYSAYKAIEDIAEPSLLDAVEECMVISMGNLPYFKGRVMSLCDNSGSALGATTSEYGTMKISTIGNLTGVVTGMRADEGYVGVFGDRFKDVRVRKRSSIFDQLNTVENIGNGIGGRTETGVWTFWNQAIRQKQHWDHVFVYSDMQAGHGKLFGELGRNSRLSQYAVGETNSIYAYVDVPKLIAEYKTKVNPKVMVYMVQIAGYSDVIVPELYDRTFILGGWSSNLLRFAGAMSSIYENIDQ